MRLLRRVGFSYLIALVLVVASFTAIISFLYPVFGEHEHAISTLSKSQVQSSTNGLNRGINDNSSSLVDQINANLQANTPSVPSISEQKQLEKIVFSNDQVQKIIGKKPYSIMAIGFRGYAIENPIKWNPVVSINVANTTRISVTVDNRTNSVTMVDSGPLTRIN